MGVPFSAGDYVITVYVVANVTVAAVGFEIAYPTEANEVFAKFPREKIEHLNSEGYKMNEEELDGKAVRLVAAWNTKDSDVDELLNTIKAN